MPKLSEVCPRIRSKVAGPFWVTVDLFFDDKERFERYHDHPNLQPAKLAEVFGAPAELVSRYPVESLNMMKISYPRQTPQGGVVERDLHSGQQYVYILDVDVS